MPRHSKLVLSRDVPAGLRLEAHVHGVALGDELVEAEREQGSTMLVVTRPAASEQDGPNGLFAVLLGCTGLSGKALSGSWNGRGCAADKGTGLILGEAEGRLDPPCQRVRRKGLVGRIDNSRCSPTHGRGKVVPRR